MSIEGGLLGAISYLIPSYTNCTVTFVDGGYVSADIAGGFVGYADLSSIQNSHITSQKQVYSDEIAGGFVGKTNMKYLVEAEVDSNLVQIVLQILNILLKILLIPNLENLDLMLYNKT